MRTLLSGPRRRRRAALAAVLALVVVPLATSSADAALCDPTDPCVIVRYVSTTDGVTERVAGPFKYSITSSPDRVADPVAYTVRKKPLGPVTAVQEGGIPNTIPVPALLSRASAEPTNTVTDPVTFSETPNRSKIPSVLNEAQVDGSYTYADGLVPAVYATADGRVGYVRPVRTNKSDVNAPDVFTTAPGASLTLTFHVTGHLVSTKIKVSPEKITTKTPASFSATITPDTDEKFDYEWNFTGGTKVQSRSATPTHTYTKRDTYAVNLSVRGDNGSYGRAATTNVKVGKPPAPPKPPSNSGTGGAGGTGGTGAGSGYIPPYVPSETTTPPSVDTPPTDDLPTMPVDDGLQEVEGFVLAGAGAEQGDSIPGTQATSEPTKASELSTGRKIGGAVIGALAVLLLLALGAEIETRWASTRLAHLRRRA